MALSQSRQTLDATELTSLPDFALLHSLMGELCKLRSHPAHSLVFELLRRYTASCALTDEEKLIQQTLGHARWGDAKCVEQIFGIKRGPLDRIRKDGLIDSSSLDDDPETKQGLVRSKRLYDLVSIMRYLERTKGIRVDARNSRRSKIKKSPTATHMKS